MTWIDVDLKRTNESLTLKIYVCQHLQIDVYEIFFASGKRPAYFSPASAWLLFASVTMGRVKKKVEPLLTPSDSTQILPACASTIFLATNKPKPEPPARPPKRRVWMRETDWARVNFWNKVAAIPRVFCL